MCAKNGKNTFKFVNSYSQKNCTYFFRTRCSYTEHGQLSDTLLVFEIALFLDALYSQFLFARVPLSLNDVVLCLPMQKSFVLVVSSRWLD